MSTSFENSNCRLFRSFSSLQRALLSLSVLFGLFVWPSRLFKQFLIAFSGSTLPRLVCRDLRFRINFLTTLFALHRTNIFNIIFFTSCPFLIPTHSWSLFKSLPQRNLLFFHQQFTFQHRTIIFLLISLSIPFTYIKTNLRNLRVFLLKKIKFLVWRLMIVKSTIRDTPCHWFFWFRDASLITGCPHLATIVHWCVFN